MRAPECAQDRASYEVVFSSGEGQRVGPYEMLRPLGVGGMATVHLGRVKVAGETRAVAIKRLHDFIAEDPVTAATLRDEAQLAAFVRHPNVVGVVDFIEGRDGTPSALVMEWVDGVDLATLRTAAERAGRRIPLDVVVAIARDVLEGLHAAHEARRGDGLPLDIVHRDVSPQNILVGIDGVIRITDFGIAKASWQTQSTELGTIKGKLSYMAPEQLEGGVDRRADLFGAGAVLWELLAGRRLRAVDGGPAQVLVQILHGVVAPPSEHVAGVACLDAVVMRALARDPGDRFATALEMARELVARVPPAPPARVAEFVADVLGRERKLEVQEVQTSVLVGEATRVVSRLARPGESRGDVRRSEARARRRQRAAPSALPLTNPTRLARRSSKISWRAPSASRRRRRTAHSVSRPRDPSVGIGSATT